jgi:hypothetical protein
MPLLDSPSNTLQVTLHAHSIQETGCIRRLVSLLNAKTGEPSKQRPRCLLKVGSARLHLPDLLCDQTKHLSAALGSERQDGVSIVRDIICGLHPCLGYTMTMH